MYVILQPLNTGSFYDACQYQGEFCSPLADIGQVTYPEDVIGYISERRNNVDIECDLHG